MKTIADIERLFEGKGNPMVDFVLSQIKAGNIDERDGLIEMILHLQQANDLLHSEYLRLLAENSALKIDRVILDNHASDLESETAHFVVKASFAEPEPPQAESTNTLGYIVPESEPAAETTPEPAPELDIPFPHSPFHSPMADVFILEPQIAAPEPEIKAEASEPPKERILPHRLKAVGPESKKKRGWPW